MKPSFSKNIIIMFNIILSDLGGNCHEIKEK